PALRHRACQPELPAIEHKEISATVRFKCADEDASYLAWTTTPWTLPSNVCLCVNANMVYCRAGKDGEAYILAKDLVSSVLGEETWKSCTNFPAARWWAACTNRCLNARQKPRPGKMRIPLLRTISYDDDGTGIVHNAPAFGEDDARVCAR
ncbi:MAG: hypothetical protein V8Q85_08125, partial [Christensenellales bacterium]